MLKSLFGNKTIEQILIFLFVNGKCYGTQLSRLLQLPLTPIQSALTRLEKGHILTSRYEGKTRLYHFNPAFPLLEEIEQLLKKAYTFLSAQEKKKYYVAKEMSYSGEDIQVNKFQVLLTFWDKLAKVQQVTFHAKSKSNEDPEWNGVGKGEVSVIKQENILIFNEKGSWQGKNQANTFRNSFRWTLDRTACLISLEHLRLGLDHPMFLFHLAPDGSQSLSSVDSHLYEGDTYFGHIHFDHQRLRLNWRVIGVKKNEEIDYYYSLETFN
jgi:hypothetical protein